MTIIQRPGEDIWLAQADCMAVPVNTVSVMGAGMALALKCMHPKLAVSHRLWCERGAQGGDILCTHFRTPGGAQIFLLATKEDWRMRSRIGWVETGLRHILGVMRPNSTVALPLLGCGRGGLHRPKVEELMQKVFSPIQDKIALVYPDYVPPAVQARGRNGDGG